MNQIVTSIFSVITILISLYLLIIFIRILSTWFRGVSFPLVDVLAKITDPYLNLFRRFKFLRLQNMDLSPLIAVLLLWFALALSGDIASSREIYFGRILEILINLLGSVIIFLFAIFAILAAIRLMGILLKASTVQPIWFTLDHMLQPILYPVLSRLSPHRVIPYATGLAIFLGVNILLWFLSSLLFPELAFLARNLRF